MKNKIFLFVSIFIFIIIFSVFYRGLHKINIYSPKVELNKEIPQYSSKLINADKLVNYSEIFNYDEIPKAHQLMYENKHSGKMVCLVQGTKS